MQADSQQSRHGHWVFPHLLRHARCPALVSESPYADPYVRDVAGSSGNLIPMPVESEKLHYFAGQLAPGLK